MSSEGEGVVGQPPGESSACLGKSCAALTVDDVYEIAKLVGAEVEKLIDGHGKESAEGLVPMIVRVLELLEGFAAGQGGRWPGEELRRAVETLQVQQRKRGAEDGGSRSDIRDLELKEQKWRSAAEELEAQVTRLSEENQELLSQLRCSHSQEDQAQRQERELMLKLKAVVDKQRDEIRAKVQEISSRTKEVEALQEQLERFMKMNGELRHKQGLVTAQLQSAAQRRADLEADLQGAHTELQQLRSRLEEAMRAAATSGAAKTEIDLTDKMVIDLKDPNRPCFTKQEVRDMLFERNELKANLFLVQEELSYYQREILNEERCPGFLLEAMRSAIRKQRNVIKAKMLGTPQDEDSSDEEERSSLFETGDGGTDCTDGAPPLESRIRNMFSFLSWSGSGRSPTEHNAGSWEILAPEETGTESPKSS
ncbi:RILP-like protein 1 [Amia ocellicauda]|uniref:RILP-like protein 1 n=1 Tax=Amia ocellicauda TaxID=2972642 RepID=UPI003463DDD1